MRKLRLVGHVQQHSSQFNIAQHGLARIVAPPREVFLVEPGSTTRMLVGILSLFAWFKRQDGSSTSEMVSDEQLKQKSRFTEALTGFSEKSGSTDEFERLRG